MERLKPPASAESSNEAPSPKGDAERRCGEFSMSPKTSWKTDLRELLLILNERGDVIGPCVECVGLLALECVPLVNASNAREARALVV